jgi:predicted RNA polymerase sigma factor
LTDSAGTHVGKLILLSHFCQKNVALIHQGLQWAQHGIQMLESEKELTDLQKNNLSGLHHIYAELLFDDGRVPEAVEMMTRAISTAAKNDIQWYLEGRLAEFRKALNPV